MEWREENLKEENWCTKRSYQEELEQLERKSL